MSRMDPIREEHDLAKEACRRYEELRTLRSSHEQMWRDIAALIRPHRTFGFGTPTARDYEEPLSSVPVIAHGNMAAGIYAGITNPATHWGRAASPDDDLMNWPPFAAWLDRMNARVHKSFGPAVSSFYPASFQAYADISAFGNAAHYDTIDARSRRFIDVTISIGQVVVVVDFHGRVIEIIRRFDLTATQARREFGDALPQAMKERAEKGGTDKFWFYHHVFRNADFVPYSLGAKGKRWTSLYATEEKHALLRLKGYRQMPFYYPRWDVDTEHTYGVGPGFVALAAARVNHRQEDAITRRSQWEADPVRLAPDRDAVPLDGDWRPGGTIYGAMRNGTKQVATETFAGNTSLTAEHQRAKQDEIREAFYYATMSLTGRTGISDDENRVIEEARLRNWAPHADRIMEEYAARKFERRWALLLEAGQLEPVPEGTPRDAQLMIQYQSAAAMALRASEAGAVRRYMMDLGPMVEMQPDLRHRLSGDDVAEVLHEASPVLPQRILRSRELAEVYRQAEQQALQAAQMAELAAPAGQGLRDMAQAGAIAQGGDGGGER